MYKILPAILLSMVSGLVFADAATVTLTWTSPPATEKVTNYQCSYAIDTNVIPANSDCGVTIGPVTSASFPVTIFSGSSVWVELRACNLIGCSSDLAIQSNVYTPTIPDPIFAPAGVTSLSVGVQ